MLTPRLRAGSVFPQVYTGMFLLGLSFWPLAVAAVMAERGPLSWSVWGSAVALVAALLALFWYVQRRCSSERLSYWNGLLVITGSMMMGSTYLSMVFVFPALLFTFAASLGFALLGEVRRSPGWAATRFHRLVAGFYRIRMRQDLGRKPAARS